MRTGIITSILLLAFILSGCSKTDLPSGVYMSNDPDGFPLPTHGYTVYIVGEIHGNQQTKLIFQAYLQKLYKEAGLRDVLLEEDQAHETDANAYVQGLTDELSPALCLRADILEQIRDFNASLPTDEKVRVHLVDVDSPLATIQKHLKEIQAQLGTAGDTLQIPYTSELKNWSPEQKDVLIEQFRKVSADQPGIRNGLDTIQQSFRWYELGNRLEIGMPTSERQTFVPIREDVITQNVQYVLSQLNGKPVLAFFGTGHAMKNSGKYNLPVEGFKSWAQRLSEAGIRVYSLAIKGKSGNGYWHKDAFEYEVEGNQQYEGVAQYQFADGTPIISLFEQYSDKEIIYVDLRAGENANIQLPSGYDPDVPINQVHDGLIIFKEFTPMEDACSQ